MLLFRVLRKFLSNALGLKRLDRVFYTVSAEGRGILSVDSVGPSGRLS